MYKRQRLPGNRSTPEWIKQKVIRLVRKDWSPGQISGHLRKKENIRVSHETIYKWIREDKKAGGDLYKHCRHRLKHRKRPVGSVRGIPNRRSIRERPVEADGKRFGDFEMDTMIGADQSEAILTVTERKTNLVMIGELPRGRDSKGLAKVLCRMLLPYKDVIRTITTDNGLEFAAHERITEMLEAPVYFTDPYSACLLYTSFIYKFKLSYHAGKYFATSGHLQHANSCQRTFRTNQPPFCRDVCLRTNGLQ